MARTGTKVATPRGKKRAVQEGSPTKNTKVDGTVEKKSKKDVGTNGAEPKEDVEYKLTKEDAELYDRQIRIWGLSSQQRMRSSKILIVGSNGLSCEIIKNLVLAGVGQLDVLDDGSVEEMDVQNQFFIRREDIGKPIAESILPRAQILNPRVKLVSHVKSTSDLPLDFYMKYNCVCICNGDLYLGEKLDTEIRSSRKENTEKSVSTKVWVTAISGGSGYILSDLGENYSYIFESKTTEKDGNTTTKKETIKLEYPSFKNVFGTTFDIKDFSLRDTDRAVSRKLRKLRNTLNPTLIGFLAVTLGTKRGKELFEKNERNIKIETSKDGSIFVKEAKSYITEKLGLDSSIVKDEEILEIAKHFNVQLGFVCAIIGGMFAQDVLKALSGKGRPIYNAFALNSFGFFGGVFEYPTKDYLPQKEAEASEAADEVALLSD